MTSKINMLEHDNNVLANENINLQVKLKRLEVRLETVEAERDYEIARVKVLRNVWDQTARDLVKAESDLERLQGRYNMAVLEWDIMIGKYHSAKRLADRLDHALNVANQALYDRD